MTLQAIKRLIATGLCTAGLAAPAYAQLPVVDVLGAIQGSLELLRSKNAAELDARGFPQPQTVSYQDATGDKVRVVYRNDRTVSVAGETLSWDAPKLQAALAARAR